MAPLSRGARAARALLGEERPGVPVPVEKIAERFAHVLREPLPNDVSGMLIPLHSHRSEMKWAIVVNSADSHVRQRFTIAHELGHLLIHKYVTAHADGRVQVRFRDYKSATGVIREEIEANQFAAELLMPENQLRQSASKLNYDIADAATDEQMFATLRRLAGKYEVSVQALSFRLANLGVG